MCRYHTTQILKETRTPCVAQFLKSMFPLIKGGYHFHSNYVIMVAYAGNKWNAFSEITKR